MHHARTSEGREPLRQPQVTRLELATTQDKSASLFSIDYGDDAPAGALVVFVARTQGVRVCELIQPASGDAESALVRALRRYEGVVSTIAKADGEVKRLGSDGSLVSR